MQSAIDGHSYTTGWNYDSLGRLDEVTYPGGNKAKYSYNIEGLASL